MFSNIITTCDLLQQKENFPGSSIRDFKSFTSVGGELDISNTFDSSEIPQTLNFTTEPEDDEPDVFQTERSDHPYCSLLSEDTSICPGGEVWISESLTAQGPELKTLPNSLGEVLKDLSESPMSTSVGDITFKSFNCPGGEVQISVDSDNQEESIIANDPDLENLSKRLKEGLEEHTKLPGHHLDHLYCCQLAEEPEQASNISRGDGEVTFRSFTCLGGEVQISDGMLIPDQSESTIGQEAEEAVLESRSRIPDSEISEEHTEFLGDHHDHPYFLTKALSSSEGHGSGSTIVSVTQLPNLNDTDFFTAVAIQDAPNLVGSTKIISCRDDHSDPAGEEDVLQFEVSVSEGQKDSIVCNHVQELLISRLTTTLKDVTMTLNASPESEAPEGPEADLPSCKALTLSEVVAFCSPGDKPEKKILSLGGLTGERKFEHSEKDLAQFGSLSGSSGTLGPSEVPEMSTETCGGALKTTEGLSRTEPQITKTEGLNEVPGGHLDDEDFLSVIEASKSSRDLEKLQNICGVTSEKMESQHSEENEKSEDSETIMQEEAVSSHLRDLEKMRDVSEIMRSEAMVDLQTQIKFWSEMVLSEPSSPQRLVSTHAWFPESPIPPPQFNSTTVGVALTPRPALDCRATMDVSGVGNGPLQEQLRKMAELLIAASVKIAAPPTVAPVLRRDACVGASPGGERREHGTNTSVVMEEKVEVSDACTSTDPLLWR